MTIVEIPSRIQILPTELADQIAAGEVVERPASVVKELAENALDAGARRIEIEIDAGGQGLIRISDDGSGMTPDEARLSLKRHATSKLRRFEELSDLHTMGFRGEALPSIAAVSRLSITTRMADAAEGVRVDVEGAIEGESRAVGAPRGTTVEVRDLFWNVPARLKFLKAEGTETAHVVDAVIRLALANPAVHFRLRVEGEAKPVVDLPPHRSAIERATAALSRRGAVHLHSAAGSEGAIRVVASLGAPTESANTSRNTYLFVNQRFVRDKALLQAVRLGYGELIERGRYPMAVVQVELPPDVVDVNVHPQKTEVRFTDAAAVNAAVRHVVRHACAAAPWLAAPASPTLRGGSAVRVYHLPPTEQAARERPPERAPAQRGMFDHGRLDEALALFGPRRTASPVPAEGRDPEDSLVAGDASPAVGAASASTLGAAGADASPGSASAPIHARVGSLGYGPAIDEPREPRASSLPRFFAGLRYLGQIDRTYLVCEAERELVLIDQHAAHERVQFERLKSAHAEQKIRTQRLLFPHMIELDDGRAAAALEHAPTLAALGFDIEPFGGPTFAVKAVPELVGDAAIATVVVDLLDELAARGSSDVVADRLDHLFATMACHSVVRAGDLLDDARVRALLDSMDGIDFRAHCPHGRPVLLRMTIGELERRFGRT